MLVFPQLTTGALTQYPVQKKHRLRTIANLLGDGSAIKLADPLSEVTEWQLQYTDLSDEEASTLRLFFESTEGSLRTFTFLDPADNLFAWSDHLDHAAWTSAPFLSLSNGIPDPRGGTSAWRLQNSGGAAQSLLQTVVAPGGYLYCLSAYVKASTGSSVTLIRAGQRADRIVPAAWTRVTFSGRGSPSAESIDFGIELSSGASLDVYGLQVEPQAGASGYRPSTLGGVYPNAAFRDDSLSLMATDVNRHSTTVKIIHANRL